MARGPVDPRLLRRESAARTALLGAAALRLVGALALVGQAIALGTAVAIVAGPEAGGSTAVATGLTTAVLGLVAFGAVRAAASGGATWIAARFGAAAKARLRATAGRSVLRSRDVPTGHAATLLGRGVDALDGWFAGYLPELAGAAVVPPVLIAWLWSADRVVAVVVAVVLPLLPVFLVLVGQRARDELARHWRAVTDLAVRTLELLRALPLLWGLRRTAEQEPVLAALDEELRRRTLRGLRSAFLSAFVLELHAMLGTAVAAVVVALRLLTGRTDLATAVAVLVVVPEVFATVRAVGQRFHASQEGGAAAEELLDVLDASTASTAARPGSTGRPPVGPIRLRGVGVTYPGRSRPALADVDLDLAPGTFTAIVGPSGSGKSTLVRVLLGLQAAEGEVTVGEGPLADLGAAWWESVAWVPQRPRAVTASVAEQLRLGSGEFADDAIAAALGAVDATFLRDLPDGLATVVGPGGRTLSQGEGRRLALARALLRDPDLLLLDEPTGDLDAAAEARVIAGLHARRPGMGLVVVTHRIELARAADRVLVLADGRIRADGPPTLLDGPAFAEVAA